MASPWAHAADAFAPVQDYTQDPAQWARDKGVALWSKQREILESIRDHPQTAVHSCHNAGKSFNAAVAVAWFLDAHPPGSAFVVTSAPTGDQVKAILWREVGRLHDRLGLAGRVNLTEWYIGSEIVAFGRKPSDYNPTAFQGIHAEFVLVILDEACGMPEALWAAASSLASNDTSRILAIGNPDDPLSHFAKVCKLGSGWSVIHIAAEHTPNFTGEAVDPIISRSLVSPAWVQARALEWGEDSPLYIAKVKGLFPEDAEDGVIPASGVAQCRRLELSADGVVHLGVDVGAGGDQSVIRERRGRVCGRVWRSRHGDPERLQQEVMAAVEETGATEIKIDSNGIGWGIAGWVRAELRDRKISCLVVPINVGEASREPDRFVNLRAELWWEIGREFSRLHLWDLSALEDAAVAELIAPKYELQQGKRIKVEAKAEVRKRLGRSPDDADALLLAFLDTYSQATSYASVVTEARIPGVRNR